MFGAYDGDDPQPNCQGFLSLSTLFGVQALANPDRLKAGLQTSGFLRDQFMVPMRSLKACSFPLIDSRELSFCTRAFTVT
jgi:hypothetical protein